MLKTYFNYIQNVLGAKSYLLPMAEPVVKEPTSYNFAVGRLTPEDREILLNIIKALKAEKTSIVELKLSAVEDQESGSSDPDPSPDVPATQVGKAKSILIIFGENAARFLMPQTSLHIGQVLNIAGSDTLLTHAISDMRVRPELKREAWQHLKAFVNN